MSKAYFFMSNKSDGYVSTTGKRDVSFPRGDGYFDRSLRKYFSTKRSKESFLRSAGWREAGELYNPEKRNDSEGANIRRRNG